MFQCKQGLTRHWPMAHQIQNNSFCIMRQSWERLRQSWDSHETVMRQSWDSHETVLRQSWDSHETVMRQSWDNHETVMRQTWDSPETVMRQSWDSHETIMRQYTTLFQLQALQTCLFLSVRYVLGYSPNGVAMAMTWLYLVIIHYLLSNRWNNPWLDRILGGTHRKKTCWYCNLRTSAKV